MFGTEGDRGRGKESQGGRWLCPNIGLGEFMAWPVSPLSNLVMSVGEHVQRADKVTVENLFLESDASVCIQVSLWVYKIVFPFGSSGTICEFHWINCTDYREPNNVNCKVLLHNLYMVVK